MTVIAPDDTLLPRSSITRLPQEQKTQNTRDATVKETIQEEKVGVESY